MKRGFIQIVIVIIGALVLLRYVYNIDVVGFLTQGRFKELLDQLFSLASNGWEKYGGVISRVWGYFVDFAKNILSKQNITAPTM